MRRVAPRARPSPRCACSPPRQRRCGRRYYDAPPTPLPPRPLSDRRADRAGLAERPAHGLAQRPRASSWSPPSWWCSPAPKSIRRGSPGLASVTAALLTKGTRRHSASELARAAESLGGALESGAGWHRSLGRDHGRRTAARCGARSRRRGRCASPVRACRTRPPARPAVDDLKVAYAQPATLAHLAAQRLVFGDGAYGHPASGTPASLPRIAVRDLLALHDARYRPDNAVLVLAGDVDADTAMRLAMRHFGGWAAPGRALSAAPPLGAVGAERRPRRR